MTTDLNTDLQTEQARVRAEFPHWDEYQVDRYAKAVVEYHQALLNLRARS